MKAGRIKGAAPGWGIILDAAPRSGLARPDHLRQATLNPTYRGSTKCQRASSPATRMMGNQPLSQRRISLRSERLHQRRAPALRIREQPMAPATTRARSGNAPASSTAPIEISTAIAIKNANTGLSRTAAATTQNLVQVGNRPMVRTPDRGNVGHSGRRWSIDGLSTSVARSPQARAGWCGGCGR